MEENFAEAHRVAHAVNDAKKTSYEVYSFLECANCQLKLEENAF